MISDAHVAEAVRAALAEDVGTGDVTTESTVPDGHRSRGTIVAKAGGVIAGLDVAAAVFRELDTGVSFVPAVADGDRVREGDVVAVVEGPTRALLTGERVALNFLQRLSGVATATAECVAALSSGRTRVLDTRKTTPGLRSLEKYAVTVGGGLNHRTGLWDMVLIKENHIAAAGGISAAVEGCRRGHPDLKIEVEVTTLDETAEALSAGADRIMLDNMSVDEMRGAISLARSVDEPPEIEVSGGVTGDTLREIAGLEPDFVSVGALTHSARALDLSFVLESQA